MKRVLLLALTMLLLAVPVATATGSYEVVACGSAPERVNNSWQPVTDAGFESSAQCSSSVTPAFLGVWDSLTSTANAQADARASWRFVAPSGTVVKGLGYERFFFKEDDDHWEVGLFVDGTTVESCSIVYPAVRCQVGGEGGAYRAIPLAGAALLEVGVRCSSSDAGECANGGTLHAASARMYGATVTLSDVSSAAVSSLEGSAFSGDYARGVRDVRFDASDNVGIRSSRLFVDGQPGSTTTYSCDFTYAVPCSDKQDAVLALDTGTLSDGEHVVRVGASDPAGNEGLSTGRTILVDNGAPAAPVSLAADGGAELTSPDFRARWVNPTGQVSPVTAAHWRLCTSDGASCESGREAGSEISELSPLTVPGRGEWRLSVWLEDAAGNFDPARGSSLLLRYGVTDSTAPVGGDVAAPAPVGTGGVTGELGGVDGSPLARIAPQTTLPLMPATPRLPARLAIRSIKRLGRSIVVRGVGAVGARGPLRVTLRSGRRRVTVERRLKTGSFRLRLRAPRAGRVTVRFSGSPAFLPGRASRTFR